MKYAGSVSLSECLTLVTAVTFVIIMVLGLRLALCLSNSNTIFFSILHFRSLNIIIGIYFNIILFPFWTSKFLVKMCCKICTTFSSHLVIYLIILTPFGVNMQSATYCSARPCHGLPLVRYILHSTQFPSNIEPVPLQWNITKCIFWHNLIFPTRTCHCAWTNYGQNYEQKVCMLTERSSGHALFFPSWFTSFVFTVSKCNPGAMS